MFNFYSHIHIADTWAVQTLKGHVRQLVELRLETAETSQSRSTLNSPESSSNHELIQLKQKSSLDIGTLICKPRLAETPGLLASASEFYGHESVAPCQAETSGTVPG